ncbi:MAG: MotA/TolQ/ExbB proton channel family protein [Cyanobacteria bacterium P01_C01_bin.89]
MNFGELFDKGGVAMGPLLFLSVLSLGTVVERCVFWIKIWLNERAIVDRVLDAVKRDWEAGAAIAKKSKKQPIGRFLSAPFKLKEPDPEVFKLALETAADEELTAMRKGEKILEATIALAPLLGLLGTVLGLIDSLGSLQLGDIGTDAGAGVTGGIGNALISTATGLIIAIINLAFYRLFQGVLLQQVKLFRRVGNELELLYRQKWAGQEPTGLSTADDGDEDEDDE